MKKFIAVLMALVLCLSVVAFAEEATVNAIAWADVEGMIAEAGWEGEFMTFEEIAVQIWMPTVLEECELTEEDVEDGYIGYFMTEDESAAVSVMYVDVDGLSIEDYCAYLTEEGLSEIEMGTVNDLPCVTYVIEDTDTCCVAFATEMGYILEVSCSPFSDEGFRPVASAIMASIQPVAE